MNWTEPKVEQAKALWALGMSAQFIADQIGAPTRNSVMGKLNRLGLLGYKKKEQSMRKKAEALVKQKRQSVLRVPPEMIEPVVVLNPEEYKCDIFQLKDTKCHWLRDDALYCGLPVRVGAPYCLDHCKMAYQPSRERKHSTYVSRR